MLDSILANKIFSHQRVWVAYSGGVDSHVLLHLIAQLKESYLNTPLNAVHINHHISPNATAWVQHCAVICKNLAIPLKVVDVYLSKQKELGLEAAAREERYRVFAELLQAGEVLVTAHNANDQAETVVLQLLRGAGPKGLAAMPVMKELGQGRLWRPLLSTSRVEIEIYAKQQQLQWIEDESNVVEDYARNFLRQQIMPKLQAQWPASLTTLTRSAAHCATAAELLDELAQEDLIKIQAGAVDQINLLELNKLKPVRQANVLRYWFSNLGFALPETKQLEELMMQTQRAEHDAQPLVSWADVECRRFANKLYVMHPQPLFRQQIYQWPAERAQLRAELGEVKIATIEQFISSRDIVGSNITIRFRQGGERCQIPGRQGTHRLKNLLQEARIPPWERGRLPLVYLNENLMGVAGLF